MLLAQARPTMINHHTSYHNLHPYFQNAGYYSSVGEMCFVLCASPMALHVYSFPSLVMSVLASRITGAHDNASNDLK